MQCRGQKQDTRMPPALKAKIMKRAAGLPVERPTMGPHALPTDIFVMLAQFLGTALSHNRSRELIVR